MFAPWLVCSQQQREEQWQRNEVTNPTHLMLGKG